MHATQKWEDACPHPDVDAKRDREKDRNLVAPFAHQCPTTRLEKTAGALAPQAIFHPEPVDQQISPGGRLLHTHPRREQSPSPRLISTPTQSLNVPQRRFLRLHPCGCCPRSRLRLAPPAFPMSCARGGGRPLNVSPVASCLRDERKPTSRARRFSRRLNHHQLSPFPQRPSQLLQTGATLCWEKG